MGTVVDEKVVEMRFDNSRFESNVRQSMNTLDKLKQKLDFSKSTKNFEELERTANRINFRPLEKSIDSVTASFSGLQIAGATVISELTKSGMRFAKKFLTISKTVTDQIKVGGKQRALNIEQAKFQLKGLGIEWSKIEDDINYGVKDTAYGLDAAAKAASQLSASNVKIGDEMKAALRGISGVAAMTNASFEEISPIFTTVAGQGKLMTMQLRQLESRGLNAAATLGKALGKTEAEIRDMVTKGKIDFNTFSKAMNDAFGEHAKEANKTFTGALSNVKAALSRIGADFYSSGLENVRKVLVKLIPTINGIHKGIKPLIEDVNNFVGRKSKSVIRFLKNFNNEIDATNRRVNKTQWDKLKEAGVVTDEFRKILKKTAKENGVNIEKMIKKDGNLRATLKRDWLSYDILTKALKRYKKVDKEAAKSEAFKSLKSEMKQTTNLEYLLKILTNIKITIKQVADAAKVAWEDIFPKDKDSNKIKNALQAFSEFSEKIKLNEDEFEKVRRTLSGVFAIIDVIAYTIKNVLNAGLEVLGYAIGDADGNLLDLTANIGDTLVKFRDWYKDSGILVNGLKKVTTVIKTIIDYIKSIKISDEPINNFTDLIKKLFEIVTGFLGPIWKVISNVFKGITDLIKNKGIGQIALIAGGVFLLVKALKLLLVPIQLILTPFKLFNKILLLTKQTLVAIKTPFVGIGKLFETTTNTIYKFGLKLQADRIASIAKAILLLSASLFVIAQIPTEKLITSSITLGVLMTGLLVFVSLFKKVSPNLRTAISASTMMLSLTLSLLGIIYALKKIESLDVKEITFEKIAIIMGGFATIIAASKLISAIKINVPISTSIALLAFIYTIIPLVDSINYISNLKTPDFKKVVTLILGFAAIVAATIPLSFIKVNITSILSLVAIVFSIKTLIDAINSISEIKIPDTKQIIAALSGLTVILTSIAILSKIKVPITSIITLVVLVHSIMPLMDAVSHIAKMKLPNLDSILKNIGKIALILGSISALYFILGKSKISLLSLGKVFIMVSVIDSLSNIIDKLSDLKVTDIAKGEIAILGMIGVIKALMIVSGRTLSLTESLTQNSGLKLLPMVLIISILSGIIIKLSKVNSADIVKGVAAIYGMVGAVGLLGILAKSCTNIAPSIPGLLIMIGAITILTNIIVAIGNLGGSNALYSVIALSTLLVSLTACVALMSYLGATMIIGALSGVASLGVFIIGLTAILFIIGEFAKKYSDSVYSGLDLLETVFTRIGEIIGKTLGSIIVSFSEQFDTFCSNMTSAFSKWSVDDSTVNSIKNVMNVIGDFAVGTFFAGVTNLISNEKTFDKLKDNLVKFAECMIAYNDAVKGESDWSSTEKSSKSLKELITALNSLPKENGLWQKAFGSAKDVDEFGNELEKFGLALVAYNKSVSSISDWTPISNSITAIEGLVEISKQIPNFGGVLQEFFGEKNMDTFGDQLYKFGVALVDYYYLVKDITDWDPVKNSATAAESLTAIAQEIPNTGGFIQDVLGTKDLDKFGGQLKKYGEAFASYSDSMKNVQLGKVEMSANITQKFVDIIKLVRKDGIYKDKKLFAFMVNLTEYILPEFEKLTDYASLNFTRGSSILRGVMNTMTEFANFIVSDDVKNLKDASEVFSVLTYSLDRLNSLDPEAATKLNSILETLASDSLKSFNDVFANSDGDVKAALESFKTNVKNGLNEILGDENTEGTLLNTFKKSGEYLVDGLIKGVKSKQSKFNKTLKSLGTKGHEAYKKSVGEHSPAKEFIESGKNIVLGLVNGVKSLFDKPGQILEDLATNMTESFNENLKLDFDMEDLTKNISSNLSTANLADMTIIPNLSISGTNATKVKKLGLQIQKELTETTAKSYIKGVSEVAVKSIPEVLKKTGAKLSKSAIKNAQSLVKESNSFVIGLYTKTDAYKEDAKNLKDHQKNLTKLLKEFKKQTAVSKHDEQINSKISSHEKSIEKLQEKIEEATDSEVKKSLNKQVKKHKKQIEQLNKKLKSKNSTKDLTSIRDNIKNAVQEIQNDRKAILEHAVQTIETLRTSLMDSIKDFSNPFKIALEDTEHKIDDIFTKFEKSTSTSFKKLLKNLNSQIKGQNLFDEYITKLTGLGYDSEVINKIKEMGAAEGTAIAKALSKATSEEVKAYNTVYSKTKGKTTKEKWIDEIQKKKNKLKEYDSLMLKASGMGFNKQVFEEIVNMDVDTAIEYLKIMTSMSKTEKDNLNKTMKESNEIAKKYANRVIGYYATAGSEAMEKLAGEMNGEKAQEIGENICNGLVEGILNNKGKVNKTGKKLGKDLLDEIRKVLGIHSPSTKFANVGFNSIRGLVNGITQNAYLVKGAIKSVSNNAVNMLNSTLSAISNSTNGDLQPTIKPLFDMSNVERGFNAMGNMFNSPYAIGLTAGVADSFAGGGINASNGNITNNKNVTFNQYNYSPEPLSRIDIYKQTQRQLRNAEGKI